MTDRMTVREPRSLTSKGTALIRAAKLRRKRTTASALPAGFIWITRYGRSITAHIISSAWETTLGVTPLCGVRIRTAQTFIADRPDANGAATCKRCAGAAAAWLGQAEKETT